MPRINLLPWREAERKKRQQDFMVALAGSVIAAAAVVGLTWFAFVQMIDAHKNDFPAFIDGPVFLASTGFKGCAS